MAQKTNSFERFWNELKRRKVVHVLTVYAATAFVILQLVDMVAEPLRLPASTKALVNLDILKQRKGMCSWFAKALQWEPAFRSFKNDPDFQNIFMEIDSKYQAEHERVRKWLEEQGML